MSETIRVGLLFGGRSVEHEVSVISARGVATALRETSLTLVPLAVTGEGRWLSPQRSLEVLVGAGARVEPGAGDESARVVVDPGGRGILLSRADTGPEPVAVDVIFPLIHGWGGEDGRLQGALELAGIPYVGAGVLGSAVGMDKAVAKTILDAHGLPVTPWVGFSRADWNRDSATILQRVLDGFVLPVFVKPANGGSSVGITRVTAAEQLEPAVAEALAHDGKVIVELGIDAREIECAVLGNDAPDASGLGEIVPSREFYDYAAKYLDGTSQLIIPAELDDETTERLREASVAAFRALGLAGFARVDFLLDRGSGRFYLNEVNTLPGFTPISMFPKLWETAGLSYPRLIERLVELALERRLAEEGRRSRLCSD